MEQLVLLIRFFSNEKTKIMGLKVMQLIYGSIEIKTWEVWVHTLNHEATEVQWLGQYACIFNVLRSTVNCYPKMIVLIYVPLSFDVLQTVHLQETMATTHFLAYLGHASEFQLAQLHQAAHGDSSPSHHLNPLSKKIKMTQKLQTSVLVKKY